MKETFSFILEEYFGGASGITLLIISLLVFILIFLFLRKKPTSSTPLPQVPDEAPILKESEPESLLIHCPACKTEISRHAPSCLKCGHPIYSTPNHKTELPTDHNQTIIIQQGARQSNGTGTAGFVLALIALILSWVPGVGWLVWLLGFFLSFIGMFKSPRGLAITGFIISILDLIILIAVFGTIAGVVSYLF